MTPNHPTPKTWCFFMTVLLLPFFMFYWIAPFVSNYTLGNDYCFYPVQNQMYMLFSLRMESFPLFIPGFFIGHSFTALTLGQIFHPFTYLASMLPGYWQGQALEWNTLLRLLSLGVSQALLCVFLTHLHLRQNLAFLLSFITVYNLRMLDLFRYGASLEAYTAHLMLISSLGLWYLQPRGQKHHTFLVILFTYMLMVSGHPQMMYFALLATILFIFIFPFYATVMLPGQQAGFKKIAGFWGKAGLLLGSGSLLASAYIFPFYYDFILTNSTRVGRDFSWADSYLDTWLGAWGNFFSPLLSTMASAFGASSLIGLTLFIPALPLFRVRVPRTIWIIWGLLISVFLCTQGGRTPFYPLLWKILPFANSFRIPGRISFFMPMLILLLLAWVINAHKRVPAKTPYPPVKILATATILTTVGLNAFIIPQLKVPLDNIPQIFSSSLYVFGLKDPFLAHSDIFLAYLATTWTGVLLLFLFLLPQEDSPHARQINVLICLLTIAQTVLVLSHGTYYWAKRPTLTFTQALQQNRVRLSYFYYPGFGLASSQVATHLQQSFSEPYLAKIYKDVTWVAGREQAYEKMKEKMSPQTVYAEKPSRLTVAPFVVNNAQEEGGRIHLDYSSYNRLRFTVQTPSPALFGLAYPYSDYWEARVNGKKAETYRINGLYLGLALPPGLSQIDFRYFSPPAFWGMVFSCQGLFLIGTFFCVSSLAGLRRITAVICVAMLSLSAFKTWQTSLYTGKNIRTAYDWFYTPPSERRNKAYGKPVTVSASLAEFHPMSMVDGDSRLNSGFVSKFHKKEPTLHLDLQEPTSIEQIILFESGNRPSTIANVVLLGQFIDQISKYVNIRPLVVDISEDGQAWQTIATITQPKQPGAPVIITVAPPCSARYIRIKSQNNVLGFDEIEIY